MGSNTILFILLVLIYLKNSVIGNGMIVRSDDFPYQGSIRWNHNLKHHCSATIIHKWFLLTAGHCVCSYVKYDMLHVVVGANSYSDKGQQTRNINKSICHDEFELGTLRKDIALIKLNRQLIFTNRVKSLPLKKISMPSNSTLMMSVWRFKENNVSPPTYFKLIPSDLLNTTYCSKFFKKQIIDKTNICTRTKGPGACIGDSGSPVLYEEQLVGIVSFGKDCNNSKYPNVHTKVSMYEKWIHEQIFLESDLELY